ncbi:hypothetical protein [Paraburkholderia sacchari]|uniref:hypothetical protein n=1 Tax=Paraburkholderia sacchari TaxID=159450 RepID=UPI000541D227|nr:hypothetical protein [Paraburkholderia sacchari]NLP63742.1 hypothetical protein [Paraburkholderia sacchari]
MYEFPAFKGLLVEKMVRKGYDDCVAMSLEKLLDRSYMQSKESVFVSNGRSTYGPISLVIATGIALACGLPSGLAIRISHDYWRLAAPVAIVAGIFVAWRLQKILVGSWYKPRYARDERQMEPRESWITGSICSAILVLLATMGVANAINQITGAPYVATYRITDKYITRGKHSCYGLIFSKIDDREDQFNVCVSQTEQNAAAPGEVVQVNGRRSKYVDELLTYTQSH